MLGRIETSVLATAYGGPKAREQALRAGALAFLERLFTGENLQAALSQAVRQFALRKL